jgi:hypothetical protein
MFLPNIGTAPFKGTFLPKYIPLKYCLSLMQFIFLKATFYYR